MCVCVCVCVRPSAAAVMGEHDESEIIEHHDDEEMEKRNRYRNDSNSLLESLTPSERDGQRSTQPSHRLLAYSDALISIIATVMVRPASCAASGYHRVNARLH